jgi:YVTN family beta-propeller protein
VPVGNGPGSIVLNPERTRAYVFNRLNDTVSLIDLSIRRVILTAATDAGPIRGVFDRRGTTLYVIHGSSPYLTLFNPDLTIRSRVFIGPSATALTVDPRTGRLYLARRATGSVDVYDPSSLLPIDSIPTDSDVAFLSIDGELNNLAMLMIQTGGVRLVNLTSRDPVAEIDIGADLYWVAFVGEG